MVTKLTADCADDADFRCQRAVERLPVAGCQLLVTAAGLFSLSILGAGTVAGGFGTAEGRLLLNCAEEVLHLRGLVPRRCFACVRDDNPIGGGGLLKFFLCAAEGGVLRHLGLHDGFKSCAAGVDRGRFQSVEHHAGFERGDGLGLEEVEHLQDGALDGVRVLEGREGIVVGRVVELLVKEAEGKFAHRRRLALHAIGLDVLAARGAVGGVHVMNLTSDYLGHCIPGLRTLDFWSRDW
jgi:hypothetical protein